jgi:hypothetical protein
MTKFLRNNYDWAHLEKGLLGYIKNAIRRCIDEFIYKS